MSNLDAQGRWQNVMMDNYGTPALELVSGNGAVVTDADGKSYVDFISGIAVNALGHAHPAIVEAVTKQIATLGHTCNFYSNPPALDLAERLLDIAQVQGKVLFCNSGAEAVEGALKISRLTGRSKIVACEGAFHGRTMGALSITGQPSKRDQFTPLLPDVVHVPFGDTAALESAVDDETAAVFIEPILGEGGVVPAPDGYLAAAREITSKHEALLVFDEVQTGIGRLGTWFAFQQAGVTPDVITLAKGIGGGLPLGAVIGVGAAGDLLKPGQHGTTFGGNPVACAAGLAVLDTIAKDGLLDHAESSGKDLTSGIEALNHPAVTGVRGKGLLLGVGLRADVAAQVAKAAVDSGFLINNVQPDAIRLAPPLVVTDEHIEGLLAALPAALTAGEQS